jgi:hypothetical protein
MGKNAVVTMTFNVPLSSDDLYEDMGQDKVTTEMKLAQEKSDIMDMSQRGDVQLLDLIQMGRPMINVALG